MRCSVTGRVRTVKPRCMIGMRQQAATFVQTWWGRALALGWLVTPPSLTQVAGEAGAQETRNMDGMVVALQDHFDSRPRLNLRQ